MSLEEIIFRISEALRYPVLVLALVALAAVLVETGAFVVELVRRRSRAQRRLERVGDEARQALVEGDRVAALDALYEIATSRTMAAVLSALVQAWGRQGAEDRMAKALADFDLRSLRRLERTRVLVRAGPALGLMGTLIPLSPALSALGRGDVRQLADGLRVAFGVTVIGILVGMIAFVVSLVRDRLYAQDHSDLEYVAAALVAEPSRPAAVQETA